jgi:60 kDa SS-A/Ro ribonucleoprotein
MAINYAKWFKKSAIPQNKPIPRSKQRKNSAGGYAWEINDWQRLDRFLILGAEGGTYHIGEQKLAEQNHDAIIRCLVADGVRAVNRIVEISDSGRAPKNDPAIFALALAATHGNDVTRAEALAMLPKVCRIGTHLFHFAEYVNAMRGWGRGLRKAVARWYNQRDADKLALQVVKYQQRDRWSHRDLLRLAHPIAATPAHDAVYRWVQSGKDGLGAREVTRRVRFREQTVAYDAVAKLPQLIEGFEKAKRVTGKKEIVKVIRDYELPLEAIPTKWLGEIAVWDALLERMPMTAMIRNLGKMTGLGLVGPFTDAARHIEKRLQDKATLRKARVHPLAVLMAHKVYSQGHGQKGQLTWQPVTKIVDALDDAFYGTFGNLKPTGQPMLLALDVSGSMGWSYLAGSSLSAREASAAMALITAATEPNHEIVAFSATSGGFGGQWGGGGGLTPVDISPRMRLAEVMKRIDALPMGGTDCALPMVWALQENLNVSAFVVYTDSETWAGKIHPTQALRKYRQRVGNAKLAVVGMTSNGFSIADPNDRGMLDIVGFDTTAPAVLADFVTA